MGIGEVGRRWCLFSMGFLEGFRDKVKHGQDFSQLQISFLEEWDETDHIPATYKLLVFSLSPLLELWLAI